MTRTAESLMAVYIYIYISKLLENKNITKIIKKIVIRAYNLGFLLLSFCVLK